MTARLALAMGLLAGTVGLANLLAQPPAPAPLRGDLPSPQLHCGTSADRDVSGRFDPLALPNGLADGEPFTFEQNPPLLAADYTGTITLRGFSVVGDIPSIQFKREDPDVPEGRMETWTRLTSRTVSGQLVSVFEPSWDAAELAKTLTRRRIGFDNPFVYWGAVQIPGSVRHVYLRVGINGLPGSPVVRVNDRVQYASDVVNLVVPTFDDARVAAGLNGFDIAAASQLFYTHFADAYDVLAFTPASTPIGNFNAFHRNVRNTVSGLNISVFDQSAQYGSRGVLQGVEVYTGSFITDYESTDHEMAHQWLSNFDWSAIARVTRAGHQPAGHSPLWTGGETLIGAALLGSRRVRSLNAGYDIERTPAPAHFHPLEMYAMGLLAPAQVPDFFVFSNQAQFDAENATAPDLGTAVQGDAIPASINDIIKVHGNRQGPAPSAWRRATVVVSRDHLVSQAEMDYWNFFAQRLNDRFQNSHPTINNFVSFPKATQNAVKLYTAIQPIGQPPLAQSLDTDNPLFGGNNIRGVTFDSPIPTRFTVGEPVTLTGHVTATDRSDFNQMALGFWLIDATAPINFRAAVSRAGDFSVTIRFADSNRGQYVLGTYLFWPNSGSQYARGILSTISVE